MNSNRQRLAVELGCAIEAETRFGIGASFKSRRHHEVMDADWDVSPITKQNKDRAWSQLGTSGSGNHFVEFGFFTSHGQIHGPEAGTYLALLSHSGSRGTGAAGCDHYSKLAFSQFPDLPSELKRLAWLSLDSGEILEAQPPRRLVIRWRNEWKPELKAEGWSQCTMELEPGGTAVKLSIIHSIECEPSKFIEAVSGGWPKIVSNLKSLLETGSIALPEAYPKCEE